MSATPLQKAIKRGDVIAARRLLAIGESPDDESLLTAVTNGDTPMVRLLLNAGANVDGSLGHGFTQAWRFRDCS